MTNSSVIVTPLWGAERMLGTNPLAIAFPGYQEPPIVIDMATSVVPFGKIEIAQRKKVPIPLGWAIDAEGYPTTDPDAVVEGGAQLTLGSDGHEERNVHGFRDHRIRNRDAARLEPAQIGALESHDRVMAGRDLTHDALRLELGQRHRPAALRS